MSEYDFVFEPRTLEQQDAINKQQEIESFTDGIRYEDMIILRKYVLKHKSLFSKWLINSIKSNI
jgi:hypothetical protein